VDEIRKKWYHKYNCSEKGKIRQKKYRDSHKEYYKNYRKKYEKSKKYKETKKNYMNSPKGIESNKIAQEKYYGSEKYKINALRKRSKRRQKFPVKLSFEDAKIIKKRDGKKCVYCKTDVFEYPIVPKYHPQQLVYDHVDSNGSTTPENLVISCWTCNESKQDSNVFEWCKRKQLKIPKVVINLLKNNIMKRGDEILMR